MFQRSQRGETDRKKKRDGGCQVTQKGIRGLTSRKKGRRERFSATKNCSTAYNEKRTVWAWDIYPLRGDNDWLKRKMWRALFPLQATS